MHFGLNSGAIGSLRGLLPHGDRRGQVASRNVNELHDSQLGLGERMADRLADLVGSWGFIASFFGLIAAWVGVNAVFLRTRAFDPYPFILLNLLLSLLAGIQAPVIMMSQNRQEAKDRLRAENDYQVNLKAEIEVAQLHQKLDLLRESQWRELLELQQRQLVLLDRVARDRGAGVTAPPGSAERIVVPRRRRSIADNSEPAEQPAPA